MISSWCKSGDCQYCPLHLKQASGKTFRCGCVECNHIAASKPKRVVKARRDDEDEDE